MKISKSELSVALFLCTIGVAAAGTYAGHSVVAPALAEAGMREHQRIEAILFVATFSSLVVALLAGLFWILPMVRQQAREQGKLHSLARLLRKRSQDFERAALTDPLTGMNNRRFFDESLRQYLLEFDRIGRPLGLMLIDLDHFKAINDTHGHDVGDQVLKSVAACLFERARYHDIVARVGGEEFALVAPNMEPVEFRRFADEVREAISALAIEVGNVSLRITTSIGMTVSEPGDENAAFLKRADIALYRAKQSGRNRVHAYSDGVTATDRELKEAV
ncbi:MAG TPA: GGDEF domain-containing protein [Aurantimonas sp.]|uniref:diguanylate cyclase n=1 Tax=Aurantimonas marianensis TaxID=2920428 RepID=A0A9X2HCE9_9HYPH|nr:GGDEF domain-containing protein [Aurantimonas marianensis]MCP3055099.1 GGDEF domain-containing protein [Aurantimonas marianensis]